MDYVIFASYGNDSIALIQWAHEHNLPNVTVVYSNTGWAANWWAARVQKGEKWVRTLGFVPIELGSEGMLNLVNRKHAWPRGGGGKFQFCTTNLKEQPALKWLDTVDLNKEATCMIGIRREESQGRATFPEWIEESSKHGGRRLHAPLVTYNEERRNELLAKTPFEPLPHRSKECWPCVNANKRDLKALDDEKIAIIKTQEEKMGINSKGNPIVMFSPKRHKGAIGINAVLEWANRDKKSEEETSGCDGGWCGS